MTRPGWIVANHAEQQQATDRVSISVPQSNHDAGNGAFDASLRHALGEAVTQFANSGAAYTGPAVMGLQENPVLREARVHAARVSAKAEVSAAGAALGVPANIIAEFLARLDLIDTVPGLNTAANIITREIEGIAGEMSLDKISQSLDDREEMIRDQRDFYANDAEYRVKTDAIRVEADAELQASDKRQAKLDDLADKNGITTPYDDEIKALRAQVDEAQRDGDDIKARELQAKLAALQIRQNEERIRQAEERGLPEVAKEFQSESKHIADSLAEAKALFREQVEAYLGAVARKMQHDGKSKAEIEAEIAKERAHFAETEKSITTQEEAEKGIKYLKLHQEALEQPVRADAKGDEQGRTSTYVAASSADVKTEKAQDSAWKTQATPLVMADASAADIKLPGFTPPGNVAPSNGRSAKI